MNRGRQDHHELPPSRDQSSSTCGSDPGGWGGQATGLHPQNMAHSQKHHSLGARWYPKYRQGTFWYRFLRLFALDDRAGPVCQPFLPTQRNGKCFPQQYLSFDDPVYQLYALPSVPAYVIKALEDIGPDSEITVNYGAGHWEANTCSCDSCSASPPIFRSHRSLVAGYSVPMASQPFHYHLSIVEVQTANSIRRRK
jgi:hypothetical protein